MSNIHIEPEDDLAKTAKLHAGHERQQADEKSNVKYGDHTPPESQAADGQERT
jgi:hypothetical protein